MKHMYLLLSKTITLVSGLFLCSLVQAQSSSTTAPGNCSALIQNFNTTSGGHASPSIYGGMFDSSFYYNPTLGYWTEMDGGRTQLAGNGRVVSIISPPYSNPNPPTTFDVGFWYKTSNVITDRFQVRLIQISPGPGGTTVANIVASSGVQAFTTWGTSAPFIDQNGNFANNGDTGKVCLRIIDADIINGPGIFYRVEIAFIEQLGFFAAYDNLSIGSTSQGQLPVNFVGVVANKLDNGIRVRWDVGDEVDVKEYLLEKSTNGATFTTVGTVPANNKTVYSFTDPNIKLPVLYYRVKSVDIDGSFKYSGIIKIVNNSSYSDNLKAYPSPARDLVTLQHSKLGTNAQVTVSTIDGKILRTIRPGEGLSNTMVDISNLPAGTYVIRLHDGKGKTESTTIIKQ